MGDRPRKKGEPTADQLAREITKEARRGQNAEASIARSRGEKQLNRKEALASHSREMALRKQHNRMLKNMKNNQTTDSNN